MNEAVPEAPVSAESMAKQGCEKLGLDTFDALVRRARTCRRFDESMRVPREFLLELAELTERSCPAGMEQDAVLELLYYAFLVMDRGILPPKLISRIFELKQLIRDVEKAHE